MIAHGTPAMCQLIACYGCCQHFRQLANIIYQQPIQMLAGTYLGLVEKLDYLQTLGINAIELLPVQEFNELEYYQVQLLPLCLSCAFNCLLFSIVPVLLPLGWATCETHIC